MAQKPITNTNGEEITFRRIRGRIVPIKKKAGSGFKQPKARKHSKGSEVAKGTGLFSAGILSGLFGGSVISEFGGEADRARKASKNLFRSGKHIKAQEQWLRAKIKQKANDAFVFSQRTNIGSGDPDFLKRQSKVFKRSAARQRLRATRLSKQGFAIGAGSIAVGGVLAAAGSRRVFEEVKGERATITEEAFTDLGSTAALGAAAHEFGLKRGVSRNTAKKLLTKILSKGRL